MFTLFHDPFYYTPTYYFQAPRYSRRQSLFERYLDDLDRRFFSLLTDDAAQLLSLEDRNRTGSSGSTSDGAAGAGTAGTTAATATATTPPSGEATPSKSAEKSAQSTQSVQPSTRPTASSRVRTQEYISHTSSIFNGRDYIEEHRERVTGADGETKIATRRRLGDRWYENEVHVDKDGKKTERETWHNVGDDDIEAFKLEWSEKHPAGKSEGESAKPATAPAPASITAPSDAPTSPDSPTDPAVAAAPAADSTASPQ